MLPNESKPVAIIIRNVPSYIRLKFQAKIAQEAEGTGEKITMAGKIIELMMGYIYR